MKLATTIVSVFLAGFSAMSQLTGVVSTQINTNCNGTDCDYSGPTILINELMISPTNNDGSISGNSGTSNGRGEWIELYNPHICESIDISCYYLGNKTDEGSGGFVIPPGTIVPPAGFCMIRGENVPPVPANLLVQNGGNVVEIVVPAYVTDPGVCAGGNRLWFPNAGGWFAFYDTNGVPQDAVSWINSAGVSGTPCIPPINGCITATSLPSYDNIPADRKTYLNTATNLQFGASVRRIPDGGAWYNQGPETYATCNGVCIQPGVSTCTGSATVTVTGGTPPYTYSWDDPQLQSTQTATGLCAGTYQVTVTDNAGQTASFQATIQDFVPTVSVNLPTEICINENPVAINVNPVAVVGQIGTLSGNGVNSTNFNPATAGAGNHVVNYYYENEFGCSNASSSSIIVHPAPIVSITNNQSPYCISDTPADLVLSPAGGQLTGTGVINNQFIPNQAGNFALTYTYQDTNSCSNSITITVQVVSPTTPTLTIPSDLCIDSDTVTMIVSPAGGTFQIDGDPSSNLFITPHEGIGNHTITYSITDANGCPASTTKDVFVHELPEINIPINQIYCFESGFHPIMATPSGGLLLGDHVAGSGIDVSQVVPGNYSVTYTYTDPFGCSSMDTENYQVTSPIHPKFTYETDCFQGALFTSAVQNPNYTHHWNIENLYQSSGTIFNNTFVTPGDYNVLLTITDNYGCIYDTTQMAHIDAGVKIENLIIPNIITPNGDGINDYLEMPEALNKCFSYNIIIVNRWGNLVYKMDSQNPTFHGLSKNGNELSEGVYFYRLESEDFDCNDDKFKGICYGNITITR